jgi:hypothetical protein
MVKNVVSTKLRIFDEWDFLYGVEAMREGFGGIDEFIF